MIDISHLNPFIYVSDKEGRQTHSDVFVEAGRNLKEYLRKNRYIIPSTLYSGTAICSASKSIDKKFLVISNQTQGIGRLRFRYNIPRNSEMYNDVILALKNNVPIIGMYITDYEETKPYIAKISVIADSGDLYVEYEPNSSKHAIEYVKHNCENITVIHAHTTLLDSIAHINAELDKKESKSKEKEERRVSRNALEAQITELQEHNAELLQSITRLKEELVSLQKLRDMVAPSYRGYGSTNARSVREYPRTPEEAFSCINELKTRKEAIKESSSILDATDAIVTLNKNGTIQTKVVAKSPVIFGTGGQVYEDYNTLFDSVGVQWTDNKEYWGLGKLTKDSISNDDEELLLLL